MDRSITFGKILSGLSKTLNIFNQIIPIYQDSKPFFKNVKNIYSIMNNNNNTSMNIVKNENPIKKSIIKKALSNKDNSPQFFI